MSLARRQLLERLSVLKACVAEPATIDGTPAEVQKNAVAGMLRSGLAVLSFAMVEAFVRDRTGEILQCFASPVVTFNDLSDDLQKAVTISALQALLFRVKNQEPTDRIPWILARLPAVSNASTNINQLSTFAFGQDRSNIGNDDIKNILTAFGIEGGWSSISAIAKRIGLGGSLDFSQSFKDLATRRHRAAHDVSALVPINDLDDSLKVILGICSALDLLLSQALSRYNSGNFPNRTNGLLQHEQVKIRFVSPHPSRTGIFREQTEIAASAQRRTIRLHSSLSDAIASALANAQRNEEHVVHLNTSGLPENWTPIR